MAECVPIAADDFEGLRGIRRRRRRSISSSSGPEAPLVLGLVDRLEAAGIKAFGPSAAAAALEGSKGFMKDLCAKHGIPTAAYHRFTEPGPAKAYSPAIALPVVIKADGLAAGKGVVIAETLAEADGGHRQHDGDRVFGEAGAAARDRGVHGGRGAQLLRPRRRQDTPCRWSPRRITSASATATPAPIPAAWAPIPRRRW